MGNEDGASPRELVVEACRRDQPHLLEQIIGDMPDKTNKQVAEFLNGVTDSMGNHALHICAMYGSYDTMDALFDVEFFECDPLTRIDGDTPLHLAVRYANEKDSELGLEMVSMMCEAGCDPRVRNKRGLKAIDLTIPQNAEPKRVLQKAEYMLNEGVQAAPAESDEDAGSGSDSE